MELISLAFVAREVAYAPYSGFAVGAALLTTQGKIYTGCNIENAAYSPSNCAERTAFFKALSEGAQHFTAIAIVGGMRDTAEGGFDFVFPCGVCRQVMVEFCHNQFEVITARSLDEYVIYTLSEIFPHVFGHEVNRL